MSLLEFSDNSRYFSLLDPKLLRWDFIKEYINIQPPFGELGLVVYLRTYSRFIPELKRREGWWETCLRVVEYSMSLLPEKPRKPSFFTLQKQKEEAEQLFDLMFNLKGFTSGRTLFVGGSEASRLFPTSNFNCSYCNVDSLKAFSDAMYLLMLGCGVGYSVEYKHVSQLPQFNKNIKLDSVQYAPLWDKHHDHTKVDYDTDGNVYIVVGDSKEGWVDALKHLLSFYTDKNSLYVESIIIDYSYIRPEGTRLRTFGGRASGHRPLQTMFEEIADRISCTKAGVIDSVTAMDIMNSIAKAIVVGGVRRSSLISFGGIEDISFRDAKKNLWTDPEKVKYQTTRVLSNNSVHLWKKPTRKRLNELFETIKNNGEPALSIAMNAAKRRENYDGSNPCHEIALANNGVCNLTTQNLVEFVDEFGNFLLEEAKRAIRLLTRVGSRVTLVDMWDKDWDYVQKRDRLLGVSLTGIVEAFNALNDAEKLKWEYYIKQLRATARKEADLYHDALGIPRSYLVTCCKPEGCYDIAHVRTTEAGLLRVDEISDVSSLGFSEVESEIKTSNGDKITKVFNKGLSEVVEIKLNNGRSFKCTTQHPLSVKGLWKNAINLQIGDILDIKLGTYNKTTDELLAQHEVKYNYLQKNDISFPAVVNEDLAWWVAAFFGNGSIQADKGHFDFMSEHIQVVEKYKQVTESLFGIQPSIKKHITKNMYTIRISSVDLVQFLEINGLLKTKDFNVPLILRKSSKSVLLSFVCGYLDTDGCFKNDTCTITTKNVKFARLFQEVTEAIGLSFSCYEHTRETTKGSGTYCDLQLSRAYSLNDSVDYINTYSVKAKFQSLIIKINHSQKNPYKVKSISVLEEMINTYDIEVENTHWYYQGGIKSHNTISQLPTVSSGIHAPYAPYYTRRIRVSKSDPIAFALKDMELVPVPENGQGDDLYAEECNTWIYSFSVKTNSKVRAIDESAIKQLERYKFFMKNWAEHMVSVTITVAEHEWDIVVDWVWKNWKYCIGIAFLPRFDPSELDSPFPNMPYESSTEEGYRKIEIDEAKLIQLISKYEQEYEEHDLDASCGSGTALCPIR